MYLILHVKPYNNNSTIQNVTWTVGSFYLIDLTNSIRVIYYYNSCKHRTTQWTKKQIQINSYPVCCRDLDDKLNRLFHKKSSIASHNESAFLSLCRVGSRNYTLDEIFSIMLILLENSNSFPQTAGSWFLVGVSLSFDSNYFRHFLP